MLPFELFQSCKTQGVNTRAHSEEYLLSSLIASCTGTQTEECDNLNLWYLQRKYKKLSSKNTAPEPPTFCKPVEFLRLSCLHARFLTPAVQDASLPLAPNCFASTFLRGVRLLFLSQLSVCSSKGTDVFLRFCSSKRTGKLKLIRLRTRSDRC